MHLAEDDLYELASAELGGRLLTDVQGMQKKHLGECRECYEKFCVYIMMLDLTGGAQEGDDLPSESDEQSKMQETAAQVRDVFLKIQMVGRLLSSIQAIGEDTAPHWNFVHVPHMARARGMGEPNESDKKDAYISQESEYSQICQKGLQLIIQLDADVFPVKYLAVRYEEAGKEKIRRFEYNEMTECHEVIIDRSGQADDMVVEIIALDSE